LLEGGEKLLRKGYREIIAGLLLLTVFFSGLLAGTAKAENGDTGNYTDTETEDEDNYEATEEALSLYSNSNTELLSSASDEIAMLSPTISENSHGLADGVVFEKYEIDYNKFPNNTVEYIVIHDTGNPSEGADAYSHYLFFGAADRGASAHYFVDDHSVIQIIDDSEGSWHSGVRYKNYATPVSNTNSIGIEMCINSDGDYDLAFRNTIDLAAYLLWTYDLPMDHLVRHYDCNGKICPLTMSDNNWALWYRFKDAVEAKLDAYPPHNEGTDVDINDHPEWYNNPILGESIMSAEAMANFLLSRNSEVTADHALRVAKAYLSLGSIYGVRGDIAFFQAMLETGYLRHGGDVDDSYMNFCGLFNWNSSDYQHFDSVEEGVEAHIQHLFAYASTEEFPEDRVLLDPRFDLITRGCRTSWEGLGGRWAVPGYDEESYSSLEEARSAHRSYGDIIIGLYASAGGLDVRTSVQPSSYDSSNYWDHPVYSGSAAGTKPILSIGMDGDSVSELQTYLAGMGFDIPVTGYFGEMTEDAVMQIQRRAGLDADGVVGEESWGYIINSYVNAEVGNGSSPVVPIDITQGQTAKTLQTPQAPTGPVKTGNRKTVYQGSEGADVLALQQMLNSTGYDLEEDGIFGGGTNAAVVSFQKKHGLDVDGIVGPATWQFLTDLVNGNQNQTGTSSEPKQSTSSGSSSKPGVSTSGRPELSYGDTGEHVTALQQALNAQGADLEVDGIFGSDTYQAVISFQRAHSLDVDGIVGPQTWGAL